MPFSYSTALSGLSASSTAIGVTGNNIANANTVGFKSSTASFADIFTDANGVRLNGAGSPIQVGNGVSVAAVHSNFGQGGLNTANSPTSAAIQGNGFFVVRNAHGEQNYTRAGDFTLDTEGHFVTPNGERVQGYAAVNGNIPPGAVLTELQLPIGQTMQPFATTEASLRMNLDSTATAGSNFHATVQVYDSRGEARTLDMTFTKQPDNSYQMAATLDGQPAQASVDSAAATAAPVTFTFDTSGQLVSPASLDIVPDQAQLGNAGLPSISLALRQTNSDGTPGAPLFTNFASPSAVTATTQNGFSAGTLSGVSIDSAGVILATFNNGQTQAVGQFALAAFNAQGALTRVGNNLYGETFASGQPSIGTPNSGGRGAIAGGMFEQSNVDITSEFVDLIVAQRSFQANSRVISTINQTMQDLLQTI